MEGLQEVQQSLAATPSASPEAREKAIKQLEAEIATSQGSPKAQPGSEQELKEAARQKKKELAQLKISKYIHKKE